MVDSWEVISSNEQDRMMEGGGYLDINTIPRANKNTDAVCVSELEDKFPIGSKLETLDTCGNVLHHTLISYVGENGPACGWITRHESGDHKGREFYLDSSFSERYKIGVKTLPHFPWEK